MQGSLSDYLETAVLNHVLRGEEFASPSQVHVALFTEVPTEAGGGTEVAGGGYERQVATFTAPISGDTRTENAEDILFPVATADWGTITSVGVFDAATGGNMLFYGTLDAEKAIAESDQFRISAGNLDISLD